MDAVSLEDLRHQGALPSGRRSVRADFKLDTVRFPPPIPLFRTGFTVPFADPNLDDGTRTLTPSPRQAY